MSFEERMELTASGNKDWQYLQAALIMAERNKGTILDGFRGLIQCVVKPLASAMGI